MSERMGLLDLEVRLLEIVEEVTNPAGEPVSSTAVLAAIEAASLLGPRHAYPLLVDLAVPWRRHLPLRSFVGNGGSPHGDEAAPARYTMVGLTDAGRLALAAERGEVGPVPFGLVDGSWWRGGLQPPNDPGAMLAALGSGEAAALVPSPVTGGTITGDLEGLAAGRPVRLVASATTTFETVVDEPRPASTTVVPDGVEGGWFAYSQKIITQDGEDDLETGVEAPEPVTASHSGQLVITHVPFGVGLDDASRHLVQ